MESVPNGAKVFLYTMLEDSITRFEMGHREKNEEVYMRHMLGDACIARLYMKHTAQILAGNVCMPTKEDFVNRLSHDDEWTQVLKHIVFKNDYQMTTSKINQYSKSPLGAEGRSPSSGGRGHHT